MSLAENVGEKKTALRAEMLARRRLLAASAGSESAALAEQALSTLPIRRILAIAGFWPLEDEINPRPLMTALLERGHAILLPRIEARGEPLEFRRWTPETALVAGPFGLQEPSRASPLMRPDIILAPLVAFDRQGNRLGHGAGFYDRTIAALRSDGKPLTVVGIAFAGQEVPSVPVNALDQKLDWIATERHCRSIA